LIDATSQGEVDIQVARLEAILGLGSSAFDPNAFILRQSILDDLETIEELQRKISDPAADAMTRRGNWLSQDYLLRRLMSRFYTSQGARGSVEDQITNNVRLIRALVQRNATNAEGFRRTFGFRGAYRLVTLFEQGGTASNDWVLQLQDALDWDEETQSPRATASGLGVEEDDFIQLVLELQVARSEQISRWKTSNGTTTEFFSDPNDLEAVEFLVANFFERGTETRRAQGADCEDALIGVCAFRSNGWSVLYTDAWASSFVEEDFGPIDLTANQYVTEYYRENVPGAGTPRDEWGGANNDPDIDGSDWIDPERVPGLITVDDLQTPSINSAALTILRHI